MPYNYRKIKSLRTNIREHSRMNAARLATYVVSPPLTVLLSLPASRETTPDAPSCLGSNCPKVITDIYFFRCARHYLNPPPVTTSRVTQTAGRPLQPRRAGYGLAWSKKQKPVREHSRMNAARLATYAVSPPVPVLLAVTVHGRPLQPRRAISN